jgi:formate hydrogenlyase subunit 3/multisubunit Na+/H+ antiporter MnhD subunit
MPKSASTKRRAVASRSAVVYQEIGETLVKGSLQTITEFNKFMIGTCFGAIPIFIGLLKLTISDSRPMQGPSLALSIVVVGVFLAGSMLAMCGYMPITDRIGLQEPDSVRQAVQSAVKLRRCMAILAMIALVVGVIGACLVVLFAFPTISPTQSN